MFENLKFDADILLSTLTKGANITPSADATKVVDLAPYEHDAQLISQAAQKLLDAAMAADDSETLLLEAYIEGASYLIRTSLALHNNLHLEELPERDQSEHKPNLIPSARDYESSVYRCRSWVEETPAKMESLQGYATKKQQFLDALKTIGALIDTTSEETESDAIFICALEESLRFLWFKKFLEWECRTPEAIQRDIDKQLALLDKLKAELNDSLDETDSDEQ